MGPIRFVPYLRPMVWGGRRLETHLGKPLPTEDAYGEAWEVSDHPLHASRVSHGPLEGRTLRDLMEERAGYLLGRHHHGHHRFPWLVKFLDCSDWLSVQVHPDEHAVRTLWPGENSKTEAWFVIDTAPGSRIYAGLLPGVDEVGLRAATAAGRVAECLHSFEPAPGDCVFLPAGTVHAVGGGVLMAEVQQTSDATFRLFDWNRRDAHGKARQLHVEESMAAIDWTQGPVNPVRVPSFARVGQPADPASPETAPVSRRQPLVDCLYFHLEYVESRVPFEIAGVHRLQLFVVLRGRGAWVTDHGPEPFGPGESWVLPARLSAGRCEPDGDMAGILCTLTEQAA